MHNEALLEVTKQLLAKADSLDEENKEELLHTLNALLTCVTGPRCHGVFVWTENEETLRVHGINATHLDVLVLLRTAHDSFLEAVQQNEVLTGQSGEVH